jgi:hypothetical protein
MAAGKKRFSSLIINKRSMLRWERSFSGGALAPEAIGAADGSARPAGLAGVEEPSRRKGLGAGVMGVETGMAKRKETHY